MCRRVFLYIVILASVINCSSGGGSSSSNDPDPWVVSIDTADAGDPLNTALLGHYDLSGALYNYDQVSGLVDEMQAVGFSEWRVGVGRWEISTEMLPKLTDGTDCPTDPLLTTGLTESQLIQIRSWFTDDVAPVTQSDLDSDAHYNLDYVRDVIDTAQAFGTTPYMSIDLMPLVLSENQTPNRTDCTASFTNAVTNHWPADNNIFALAVKGLVQRIVEGDSNGTARPVKYWEVWNEPEFPYFWDEGLAANPTRFFDMATLVLAVLDDYRNTSSNANAQALKIGLASFAGAATAATVVEQFDAASVTAGSRAVPLDFISFHSYHNDPLAIATDISTVADAVANSTYYQDLELVLAEWGSDLDTTTSDPDYANSMDPPLLMSSVIAMGAALGLDRAHHAIYYDFHPGIKLGLIGNDGSPKPLYHAYELLSESITAGSVMLVPDNATDNQLTNNGAVLVTRDSGGTVRALFINRDTSTHTASLENASGAMTAVQTKVFADHTAPVVTQSVNTTRVTVPGRSLVLAEYL
jgi:hypothetical protein